MLRRNAGLFLIVSAYLFVCDTVLSINSLVNTVFNIDSGLFAPSGSTVFPETSVKENLIFLDHLANYHGSYLFERVVH